MKLLGSMAGFYMFMIVICFLSGILLLLNSFVLIPEMTREIKVKYNGTDTDFEVDCVSTQRAGVVLCLLSVIFFLRAVPYFLCLCGPENNIYYNVLLSNLRNRMAADLMEFTLDNLVKDFRKFQRTDETVFATKCSSESPMADDGTMRTVMEESTDYLDRLLETTETSGHSAMETNLDSTKA